MLNRTGNTSGVGPALASVFRAVDEKVLRAARHSIYFGGGILTTSNKAGKRVHS